MPDEPEPEMYDIERALLQIGQSRLLVSELVHAQAGIGDQLAVHIRRHFETPAEREAVGLALVLVAASVQVFCADPQLAITVPGIVGLAGQWLVGDARAESAEVSGG